MPNYDYHDTITIRETPDTITIKCLISRCITILSTFPNQMNLVYFLKGRPVQMSNITALLNISFATILTHCSRETGKRVIDKQ